MKNINTIIFACLVMTVGSLSALSEKLGNSSETWSSTQDFTVHHTLQIDGKSVDTNGMTGNYNPKTKVAMISDRNGVLYTCDSVTAINTALLSLNQKKIAESGSLIGSYSVRGNAPTCGWGQPCSGAVSKDATYNLYGTLIVTNN